MEVKMMMKSKEPDIQIETMRLQMEAELLSVRDKFIEGLLALETNIVDLNAKLTVEGIPYIERSKRVDAERLTKIGLAIARLKRGSINHSEVAQWCFENRDLSFWDKRMAQEAFYYFDIYYEWHDTN